MIYQWLVRFENEMAFDHVKSDRAFLYKTIMNKRIVEYRVWQNDNWMHFDFEVI
jgi:hypothetical protein